MPSTTIESAYTAPHERKNGPWHDHELDDAGRHVEMADKIKGNPKFAEAVAKHHEKKAKRHHALAAGMKVHMKRGLVSEKQLEKASKSNHG